jgi:hypothetical protein
MPVTVADIRKIATTAGGSGPNAATTTMIPAGTRPISSRSRHSRSAAAATSVLPAAKPASSKAWRSMVSFHRTSVTISECARPHVIGINAPRTVIRTRRLHKGGGKARPTCPAMFEACTVLFSCATVV